MSKSLYWLFKQFPAEAEIIGRLVMGYGEMEYHLSYTVTHILDDENTAFKVIFRAPGEVARILAADALARLKIGDPRLRTLFEQAIAGMHVCRKIRNQYAHCHWVNTGRDMAFRVFEEVAAQNTPLVASKSPLCYVDLPLLQQQEAYFWYVYETFAYICYEYQLILGSPPTSPVRVAPQSIPPPKLYN